MIECYKLANKLYDQNVNKILTLHEDVVARAGKTRGHNKKLYVNKAKKVIGSRGFTHRINDVWNNLPEKLVNAPSVNAFKSGLDRHWEKEEIVYDFRKIYNKFRVRGRPENFDFDLEGF